MKCDLTLVFFVALIGAVFGANEEHAVFEEDFSNYDVTAPNVVRDDGVLLKSDPIRGRCGWAEVNVRKDISLFIKPIPLPRCGSFDFLFTFELMETNSAFDVVFATAGGLMQVVPFAGYETCRDAAIKVADRQMDVWVTKTNGFVRVASLPVSERFESVDFRVRAGGKVRLTRLVVREPAPFESRAAIKQFPDRAALEQGLEGARAIAGRSVDLLGRSVSFVPGTTGTVGRIEVAWDSGVVKRYPVVVGSAVFTPIKRRPFPQLGLEAGQRWEGADGVISFGEKVKLYVRPNLNIFASNKGLVAKGLDVVRDWDRLPPASRHVTTLEMREADGACQLWLDGSFVTNIRSDRKDGKSKRVVRASLFFDKDVACRFNIVDPNLLQLWARPKAKSFASCEFRGTVPVDSVKPLESADVGLAHYAQGNYNMTYDAYTMRAPTDGYPGEVHFRLPAAPYASAVILFCLDDAPDKVPVLRTRLAHYDCRHGSGCTEIEDSVLDFTDGIPSSVAKVGVLVRNDREYPIYRVEIDLPIGPCIDFAAGDYMDLEFLGPTEDNFQQCDNTQKPREDISSAFNLLGVRLRRLNVLPEMVQAAPGNVFTLDEESKTTAVKLTALVDGARGVLSFGEEKRSYALMHKGDVVTNVFNLSMSETGVFTVPVVVDDGVSRIRHELRCCIAPESGRLATAEESPYGTWWFSVHGSSGDPDLGGPLLQKAGIRKVGWRKDLSVEERRKYGYTSAGYVKTGFKDFDAATGRFRGNQKHPDGEERVVAELKAAIAKKPFADHIMVWHESAPRCGIPEELLGLPAPTNDVVREKEMASYINEIGRICRKHFPNLKIQIGNSGASVGAAVVPLRGGANPEYYDILGMEIPSQTVPPERLSGEVGFLGQNIACAAAKKISGRDIRAGGCFEYIYRTPRDLGADGEETQARFYMRDQLIAMMKGFTLASPGELFDCRTAYCNTIWGVNGFAGRSPFFYPKKSYLAYAVLTKVLDGVKFIREIPTGSTTVYASEFRRKDGRFATAFWCARGEADLLCGIKGDLWTMYGARSDVGLRGEDSAFTCSGAPVYVISPEPCKSLKVVARRFPEDAAVAARGTRVVDFSLANVTVAPDPEMESRHRQFLPYRKPGVFIVKDVVDPDEGACLELTLDTQATRAYPVTEFVTEYTTVRLNRPVEIPGETALLGLRVKGDSSWGQVRFEIEDSKGEVFKGLSTGTSWQCDIYDWPGYTALSFDKWSDVFQYTDVNETGLIISPGPRDEQWVSSTGGDKKIDYPVKLRAVTICSSRYKPTIFGFKQVENPSVRIKSVWAVPKRKQGKSEKK